MRFSTIDPLAEKYYSISSYAYYGNNPINRIDPTGIYIDPVNIDQWNNEKEKIQNEADKLRLKNKTGEFDTRLLYLHNTLDVMSLAESSPQLYQLQKAKKEGEVRYDPALGAVVIFYNGTPNFVHEITHVGQFESGNIGFSRETGNSIAQDVWDEVEAYKAQYSFSPSSLSIIKNIDQITPYFVQNIVDSEGYKPYSVGGWANTGRSTLNANSRASDLMHAYPNDIFRYIPMLGNSLKDYTIFLFK